MLLWKIFNGTVHITGSVKPGFRVKAASDIIVDKDVEDAQLVQVEILLLSWVLWEGISKADCRRQIQARFMQNARVEAVKSVIVEDSIINCEIISYDYNCCSQQAG